MSQPANPSAHADNCASLAPGFGPEDCDCGTPTETAPAPLAHALGEALAQPPIQTRRPTAFTPALGERICELMLGGDGDNDVPPGLRQLCRENPDLPAPATIYRWLLRDEPEFLRFREQYARARETQGEILADQTIEIADNTQEGVTLKTEDGKVQRIEGDMLGHRRLRIDTRKWAAGKLAPKKYGDKLQIGGDGGGVPIAISITGDDAKM